MTGPVLWLAALLLYLLFWILVNGVFALVVRSFPQSWFDPRRALYRPRRGEQRLYRRLRINRWKGRLPDCGWMTGFSKSRVALSGNAAADSRFLQTFITETCMAELGHLLMGPLGFLSLLAAPLWPGQPPGWLWPLLCVVAILHLLFQLALVLAQRFNRPRLMKLQALLTASE